MAVLVELELPGVSEEQVTAAQMAGVARGQELGRPPYPGCLFVAVSAHGAGYRMTAAWRTEAEFQATFAEALQPDLASAGIDVPQPVLSPVIAMAIPGTQPTV